MFADVLRHWLLLAWPSQFEDWHEVIMRDVYSMFLTAVIRSFRDALSGCSRNLLI